METQNEERRVSRRSLVLLAVLTILLLVPFAGKAFHIDDPLFIWTARQIQSDWADPYGFSVNWYASPEPMSDVTKNPPLAAYYIAGAARLVGWHESALHLAMLVWAIAAVLGTYLLACRFSPRPLEAALICLLTPVFLLSASTLMCDMMMLAFWVWAMFAWVRGIDKGSPIMLCIAAFLVIPCALSKYYGVALIPLMAAYSVAVSRRLTWRIAYLAIPIAALVGYDVATSYLYDKPLLTDALFYASATRQASWGSLLARVGVGLSFTGGCMATILFYMHRLPSRSRVYTIAAAAIAVGLVVVLSRSDAILGLRDPSGLHWATILELGVFILAGLMILRLPFDATLKRRDPDSVLLLLWVIGTFAFAAFFNWSCNGRSILPMVPAAAILLVRRIGEREKDASADGIRWKLAWPLVLAMILSLAVTWADYSMANSVRSTARTLLAQYRGKNVWFEGHWGFQYYMEKGGAQPMNMMYPSCVPGDVLVIPENNSNVSAPSTDAVREFEIRQVQASRWLATIDYRLGAGFPGDIFGPLPFVIGKVPPEKYLVFEVRNPERLAAQ